MIATRWLRSRREMKIIVCQAKAEYILQKRNERFAMINIDTLKDNWKYLRGRVHQEWKALSDNDLEVIDGHFDVLVDLLREKYGYSRKYAEDEVQRFIQAAIGQAL